MSSIDNRKALPKGMILDLQGIKCEMGDEIGRGSNAIVYEGSYRDSLEPDKLHRVLVKELFPLHSQGKIYRREDGSVCVEPEGEDTFRMHSKSFEAGNRAHLDLLETYPDQIGANLNSYKLNGTMYTLLGVSGGESLSKCGSVPARSLRACAARMLAILDALEVFHKNGLAHLDIAPDNILLIGSGSRERAMLIDYNSALEVGAPRGTEPLMLSIKQGYTAPEVRTGNIRSIGFVSDMYSVTAVFYRLLTGSSLTGFQMISRTPPDVSDCTCVKDEPETVKVWVREILKRGLCTLPARRYKDTASMRRDLEELIDRIDGIGITHWAVWESGRRQAERMISENPSLSFIRDAAKLFPSVVSDGENIYPAETYMTEMQENCMLLAGGGMGKTTALLHIAFSGDRKYSPERPAVMYLSLYGWQPGERSYIINSLLEGLHFHADTHTYEEAGKSLYELLDRPVGNSGTPALLLLLDGLNEVTGDPEALLAEIKRLSSLRGVRMVIASRAEEASLPFTRLKLSELTDEMVENAVSAEGLLLPETEEMRRLLRTPMMLSMYIRSGQIEDKQVRVSSADELMREYLNALKEKATKDLSEKTDRRWQIETAVDLVLPAVAAEIRKKQRGMTDRELLPITEKCYKLLNGRLSRRFFPQWIGRGAAIRGTAKNAEEWYGQIVHDILWKQLGALIRNGSGSYMISHQAIGDYLMSLNRENSKKVRRYQRTRAALAGLCACLVLASSFAVYRTFIAPPPYDEMYADSVMNRALSAYASAGQQYEQLSSLAAAAAEDPSSFGKNVSLFRNSIGYNGMSAERSLQYLSEMMETGSVMPWSSVPMDEDACRRLLTLSDSRSEEYALFADVLEFVMTDEFANRHYGEEFPKLLVRVLETDADIAAELYTIVCVPHMTGKYADGSYDADSFGKLFAKVPKQNAHLTDENSNHAKLSLTALDGERNKYVSDLYNCGAFEEYERSCRTAESSLS